MMLKWLRRDKPGSDTGTGASPPLSSARDATADDAVDVAVEPASPSPPPQPAFAEGGAASGRRDGVAAVCGRLPAEALRRTVDPASFGFATTADIEPVDEPIGQERALEAIAFGAAMPALDFNIFVLGPPASGKSTAVRAHLTAIAAERPSPKDWVYVHNFDQPARPNAIALPPGRARPFAAAVLAVLDELAATVPSVFDGDDFQARRRAVDEEFRAAQEHRFADLNKRAEAQNITILRTPTGFVMAPMHDGEVVKPETFATLPETYREDVARRIESLQNELADIIESVPRLEKERRSRLAALIASDSERVVSAALAPVRAAFAEHAEIAGYLDRMATALVGDIAVFMRAPRDDELVAEPLDTARDPRLRRFLVNVLVARAEGAAGAPVHEELNPTYTNLVGRVDHKAHMGALLTDFLMVSPGALHLANGGYLLLDAMKLLGAPFAWEALKRALRSGEIRIEQPAEIAGLMATETLQPEPIPLEIKVVLFGSSELYALLSAADPEFAGLFKVQADFDDAVRRSADSDRKFAGLVASIVARHDLKPVSAAGVARLIEVASRLAEDREKISTRIGQIADVVREADFRAGKEGRQTIDAGDVESAEASRRRRAGRLGERSQEGIARGITLIETDGARVGQVNGLAVYESGGLAFGRPVRISARVRFGSGRVTDIEREAKLGGPLHTKGVMILWGYLAGRYALEGSLALAASLVMEQSYGGVEGDSASSAELYALLSALAEVGVEQGLAVTGSVNQWGEVQAIGGVNAKIEGHFDICAERGLTGRQGVLIPLSNAQHLMLRSDVVEAVRDGRFHIHTVSTIDEGIALLTGKPAGERGTDGRFPDGSINALVEAKLESYSRRALHERSETGSRNGGPRDVS